LRNFWEVRLPCVVSAIITDGHLVIFVALSETFSGSVRGLVEGLTATHASGDLLTRARARHGWARVVPNLHRPLMRSLGTRLKAPPVITSVQPTGATAVPVGDRGDVLSTGCDGTVPAEDNFSHLIGISGQVGNAHSEEDGSAVNCL
jgi:hypothetical protein